MRQQLGLAPSLPVDAVRLEDLPTLKTGTAVLNFGAVPGTGYVQTVVTGQTGIVAGSAIRIWIDGDDSTATHNSLEHMIAPLRLYPSAIVAGVGFTINAIIDWRLTGTFAVRWAWQ